MLRRRGTKEQFCSGCWKKWVLAGISFKESVPTHMSARKVVKEEDLAVL